MFEDIFKDQDTIEEDFIEDLEEEEVCSCGEECDCGGDEADSGCGGCGSCGGGITVLSPRDNTTFNDILKRTLGI